MKSITGSLYVAMLVAATAIAGCRNETNLTGPSAVLDEFGPGSVTTSSDVIAWANMASSPNAYFYAVFPSFIPAFAEDPECPVFTQTSGANATYYLYEGGCTDIAGNEWTGQLQIDVETEGEGEDATTLSLYTYDDFGVATTSTCDGVSFTAFSKWNGTLDDEFFEFAIDFREDTAYIDPDTCEVTANIVAIDYEGTYQPGEDEDGDDVPDSETWGGSGRIGTEAMGTIRASTDAEVIASGVCEMEAASGTTTLKADGHTSIITYDGATDCDDTSTVRWELDGEDRGELEGIACDVAGFGASPAGIGTMLGGLVSLLAFRRRTR